jgi:hypothetical protein
MKNNLSVIETKDLGKAREAYESYYTKQKKYHQYFSRYQKLVKAYAARNLLTIKIQEMRYLDNMANTSEQLQSEYFKMKSILSDKFHQIMLDIKQKETDVAAYTQLITDELGLDDGRNLIEEALNLRNSNRLVEAIDTAYMAHILFKNLLLKIRQRWISGHQQNLILHAESEFGVQLVE